MFFIFIAISSIADKCKDRTAEYDLQSSRHMWNTGVIVLLGIWMVIAPIVLPDPTAHAWNNRIIGILVIALALASPRGYRWEVFATCAVGGWLFASSFVPALSVVGDLVWNDLVTGFLLIVTGTCAMKTPERVAPKLPP